MNYKQKRTMEFITHIRELGFKVYLAMSGSYGFITDDKGDRVMSFSFDGLEESLGGNYGPPSQESGTGWRINVSPAQLQTKDDVTKALYSSAPDYCGRGWKRYTSVKEYLGMYGESSGFVEVTQ
jgi:hypothetical protein